MAKHFIETKVQNDGVDSEVPETIRNPRHRRLLRLSEATRKLLALASVVGREFTLPVLQDLEGMPDVVALDALEEAVAARIIVEDSRTPGRFSFTHALIRKSCTGHTWSSDPASSSDRPGHRAPFSSAARRSATWRITCQAVSFCDAEKATDYASRAGDRALETFALEDAARYYEMALQSLGQAVSGQDLQNRQRELHGKRGRSYFQAGQWESAKTAFEAALALSPESDDTTRVELLVRLAETSFWLMNIANVQRFAVEAYALADPGPRRPRRGCFAWMAGAKISDGDVATGSNWIGKLWSARVGSAPSA